MSLKIQNVVNILGIIKELGHAIYKMVKSEKDKKSKEQDAATV